MKNWVELYKKLLFIKTPPFSSFGFAFSRIGEPPKLTFSRTEVCEIFSELLTDTLSFLINDDYEYIISNFTLLNSFRDSVSLESSKSFEDFI